MAHRAWFTGWFNVTGLVAGVASVDYAAATLLDAKNKFKGPVRTIEWDEAAGIVEEEPLEPSGPEPAPAN